MKNYIRVSCVVLWLLAGAGVMPVLAAQSILAVSTTDSGRMQKSSLQSYATRMQAGIESRSLEQMTYRGFTILLNVTSGNAYEMQVYRQVLFGNRRVSSIYSSVYKSSVEYAYEYDSAKKRIIQHHFLFPPNSLTGWSNPNEWAMMQAFDWGEPFPVQHCSMKTPIHTSEEVGREYLEASCFPDRNSALQFAHSFIDYMLSSRGM